MQRYTFLSFFILYGDAVLYQDKILVRQLGLQPYEAISQAMHNFMRDENSHDEIWLVELTRYEGEAGKLGTYIDARRYSRCAERDRGGRVTYHGRANR